MTELTVTISAYLNGLGHRHELINRQCVEHCANAILYFKYLYFHFYFLVYLSDDVFKHTYIYVSTLLIKIFKYI